jgi:gamma-glutamyltranspeptidase/glutathione hydrolase
MSNQLNRKSEGTIAMVSSGKAEASQVGIEILNNGGNAIDAAVAVGFAIGVAEPATSGIGGGGFMTIKTANQEEPVFIDFREFAPENATPDMWQLDQDGKVKNKENAIGAKSISVPGEVAGMIEALERYGTMSLEEVMAPAIRLADEGIVVTEMMKQMLDEYAHHLEKCDDAKKIFLNNGNGYCVGDCFKNLDLANSLRKIAAKGRKVFYEGEIADAIIETVQKSGGVMTHNDLADYKVEVKKPIVGKYRGYKIISSPPPSSGGAHIIQTLNILENYDMGALDVNSAAYVHLFSEAFKLVYEDRTKFMGDTDFVDVPLNGIRSKEYARILSEKIDVNTARNPDFYDPWKYEHEDTTHYSIGDESGNLVSVTKTINHFFGSCMVAKGTGILLNDTMADFSTKKYDVNSVDRRKKPLSTMAPTIVLKKDKPFAVIGSPGGARIINIVAQVISKLIDHDMDIQDAINSPRITQNTSNIIYYEHRLNSGVVDNLEQMGHEVYERLQWDKKMGGVNGIKFLDDGTITGGADPRRDGKALGI